MPKIREFALQPLLSPLRKLNPFFLILFFLLPHRLPGTFAPLLAKVAILE